MFRLAGIVSDQPSVEIGTRVAAMLDSMRCGPSEVARLYPIPALGCCLGWISDASERDPDAMIIEADGRVLVLSGELFGDNGPVAMNDRTNRVSAPLLKLDELHGD